MATEVAKASAIAKRMDVKLAPVPAYRVLGESMRRITQDCAGREAGVRSESRRRGHQDQSHQRQRLGAARARVEVLASSEGSCIEQEVFTTTPSFTVTARKDGQTRARTFSAVPMTGGWEVAEAAKMLEDARTHRRRGGRVLRPSRSRWASRTSCSLLRTRC